MEDQGLTDRAEGRIAFPGSGQFARSSVPPGRSVFEQSDLGRALRPRGVTLRSDKEAQMVTLSPMPASRGFMMGRQLAWLGG